MSSSVFRMIGICLFALAFAIQPCIAQDCLELAEQSYLLGAADGPFHLAAAPLGKGLIAALASDSTLVVYRRTARGAPVEKNRLHLESAYRWMAGRGKFVYVAGESGVQVFKIDKHGRISARGPLSGGEAAGRIKADGNRLAVVHEGGWSLWDCDERSTPLLVARVAGDMDLNSRIALGSDRVVADGVVYDITDPVTPVELGYIPGAGTAMECEIAGDRLYGLHQSVQSGGSWIYGDRWYYRTYGVSVRDLTDTAEFTALASYGFRYSTAYPTSAPRVVLAKNGDSILAGRTGDPNLLMIDASEPADAEARWIPVLPSTALVHQAGQVVGLGDGVWAFRVPETTEPGRVSLPSTDIGSSSASTSTWYTMVGADAAGDLLAVGVHTSSSSEWFWDEWTTTRIYESMSGHLELVSTVEAWGEPMAMIDGYLLLGGYRLRAVDLSDPAVPGDAVTVPELESYHAITSPGGRMIAAANDAGDFRVFDLSDPTAPVLLGSCQLEGRATGAVTDGDRVLVGLRYPNSIAVVDVSVPAEPRVEHIISMEGTVQKIAGHDGRGIALTSIDGKRCQVDFEYASREHPPHRERDASKRLDDVRTMRLPMYINGLTWHGRHVFMSGGGVHAYDPLRRKYVGSVATTHRYLGIVSNGERLYAVCAEELIDITDVACGTVSSEESFRAAGVEAPRAPLAISAAPNPFNPRTEFTFSLEREQWVDLAVFDIRGRCVRALASGTRTADRHTIIWNGCDDSGRSLPSGTYFARLRAGDEAEVARVVLIK